MTCLACPGASWPQITAAPCSLTMKLCWKDVTGPSIRGTTADTSALGCQDGSAMIACPPGEVQRADHEVRLPAEHARQLPFSDDAYQSLR